MSSSLRQDNTPAQPVIFIAIITKYLLATDEIRYLQQSTFTKQENLHTLSFYICLGNERQEKYDAA